MSSKVLIITYYWPPGSGAGVQRWLKFSKYLPYFDCEPVILTVEPEYAAYPALDYSMEAEISSGLKVYKTPATDYFRIYKKKKSGIPSAGFAANEGSGLKSKLMRFVRGNFFIPDPRKGWNSYAFQKACDIIEVEGIDKIITTSPPHSTQLIGLKIKKRYPGIKWIADLRDPWTDIYYYDQFYPTFFSKRLDKRYEEMVLESCDKIITVGKSLKELFAEKLSGERNKIEVITNGFDAEDFKVTGASGPSRFTISYIGTLSDAYPAEGFLKAVQNYLAKGNDICLRFVGSVSQKQKAMISSMISESSLEFIPYVEHREAIKYMSDTSALLLIIPDHKSNRSIITGKLFEYMAALKPVLCLAPVDGDAADILKESGCGLSYDYTDSAGIEKWLVNQPGSSLLPGSLVSSPFNRKNLTAKLVAVLDAL